MRSGRSHSGNIVYHENTGLKVSDVAWQKLENKLYVTILTLKDYYELC